VVDGELRDALATSQRLGLLGARPVEEVIAHAWAFVNALADVRGTVLDLGSGGGVPGLVIAVARADLRTLLVDRRAARTDHLARLVGRLRLGDRVRVITADATRLHLEEPADAVVARGFGAPLATAAAAGPLTRPGAVLIVSEPPTPDPARWPAARLAALGFERQSWPDSRVAVLRRVPRET
jgi:16S rRNA (guanine527-N7)-methyltransferase